MTPDLNITPDIKISVKQTFGFESDMEVDAFSKKNEYVPTIDPDYIFDRDTTLAILSGFSNNKKVIVFAEDVAASGGYLIACAGDEIYANSSSIVGSIGVISASFGFQDAIKRIGVQRRVYTAGKNKSTLDPFKEEKPEDIERIKKLQLELHSDFINLVKKSRGSKLKDPDKNNTFTGEFWSGSTSLKLGLIDGIGNAEQILREKFGENIEIKKFEKQKGFLAKRLSSSLDNQVDNVVSVIEERALWQKFGL